MTIEFVYRFCVREKQTEELQVKIRPIFITRYHLTEEAAHERYEVVERLVHTARDVRLHQAIYGNI